MGSKIILVKTCRKFIERRQAIERTWGQDLNPYYVCGDASCDSYRDNSIKLREGLRWLLKNVAFKYVFVCDDDTFIHPERWLSHDPKGKVEGLFTDEIPWLHGGAGWYMSRGVCKVYVNKVRRRGSDDDVQASRLHNSITNRPDLYSQWRWHRVSEQNSLITCHYVTPKEMEDLYENRSRST